MTKERLKLEPGSPEWYRARAAEVRGSGKKVSQYTLFTEIAEALERSTFAQLFNVTAKGVHQTAVDKGWWDSRRQTELQCATSPELKAAAVSANNGSLIALMHSELSEALEALRAGNPPDDKIPEFTGVEAELADVVIRIMDAAAARGWRVGEAIERKIEMNKGRSFMHGGKKF